MNKNYKKINIGLLSVLALVFYFTSCDTQESDKIPITTSSEEALQNYLQGRELAEKLQRLESLQYFKKAIQIDSNFALAYLNYAAAQHPFKGFFKQMDKAVSLINKISDGEKYMILGFREGINANPMKQKEYYGKIVELYPNDERSHGLLGNFYFSQQEYANAIYQYKKALQINKKFSPIYNQLGYCYRFLEKYDDAEKAFKKYIHLIPHDPNPYDSYAELLMKMGEYEASLDQYEKALQQDSNFVPSHIGIATNLNYISKHDEARSELERLYKMARNNAEKREALYATAVSYVDEGNYNAGINEIKKQYLLSEKNSDFAAMANDMATIGNILLESGKYDEAVKNYKKAIALIDNSDITVEIKNNINLDVLFVKALILLKKKEFKAADSKATQYFSEVKSKENLNQIRTGHELFGRIALEEKNYEKAIAELKKSNLHNPYNLYRLAIAYSGVDDKINAKEYLEKTVNFNGLNNMNYAFCRNNAKKMLIDMQ